MVHPGKGRKNRKLKIIRRLRPLFYRRPCNALQEKSLLLVFVKYWSLIDASATYCQMEKGRPSFVQACLQIIILNWPEPGLLHQPCCVLSLLPCHFKDGQRQIWFQQFHDCHKLYFINSEYNFRDTFFMMTSAVRALMSFQRRWGWLWLHS